MANICIIEDEMDILNDLSFFLKSQNNTVYPCNNYLEFCDKNLNDLDGLFIIDWDLGDKVSGLDIVKEIRKTNTKSLIYMLTGNTHSQSAVEALKSGVDDYIKKPFCFEELILKIENALTRHNGIDSKSIILIPEAYAFQSQGQTVSLTSREYTIFEKLYNEKNSTVPREVLINSFQANDNITERNIDVHIFSLRKKIKNTTITIKSIRSVGYILEE